MKNYPFRKIEKKWTAFWLKKKVFQPDLKKAKKPFYNLMMFPYPSAEGLHVGNMYAFTGSDIYGRFTRMQGHDVFEPIGLDGFGIHSENYAIKIGAHPMKQAKKTEKNFYRQLLMIGNGFAWDNRLETYDPEYYRWTQWIFTELFKAGLAFRKKSPVNWCPSCKTVLADEQVISGKCERCDSEVVKKDLEQWFFKTTKYAERLLNNLDKLDWSEKVKNRPKELDRPLRRSSDQIRRFRAEVADSCFHDKAGHHPRRDLSGTRSGERDHPVVTKEDQKLGRSRKIRCQSRRKIRSRKNQRGKGKNRRRTQRRESDQSGKQHGNPDLGF